jgi:two-component system sensor histidine kinase RegB
MDGEAPPREPAADADETGASPTIKGRALAFGAKAAEAPGPYDEGAAGLHNMTLLIQLRWIAVAGQIATVVFVRVWLGVALPLYPMVAILAALVVLNFATSVWLGRQREVGTRALFVALLLDLVALTAQLWLSGGATNPFTWLYLLQVTLAAVMLNTPAAVGIAALACAAIIGLSLSSLPLAFPASESGHTFSLYVAGMVICFLLVAVLLPVFVTRVTRNLRQRDAHLAALQQRAAEEEQIVRMGLLTAGAAHELGTPLSSLSVILGDWRRMPLVQNDQGMVEELEEMRAAVQRCKAIVTEILLSTGAARGEQSSPTTLSAFIETLAREWSVYRSTKALSLVNHVKSTDTPAVFDIVIKQAIFNLLDNAHEASPGWVGLSAEVDAGQFIIKVSDSGPGFDQKMLENIGKPYRSTRGRPGGGLGLFLVANVARTLNGSLSAHNTTLGGAEVTLRLPVAAFAIAERDDA